MTSKTTKATSKTTAAKTTPVKKPSRTKIAREALVAILVKANAPMDSKTLIERALADRKVKAACCPRGTVTAQLSFALAEDPARIVRVGRALYAAAGVEVEAAPAEVTA